MVNIAGIVLDKEQVAQATENQIQVLHLGALLQEVEAGFAFHNLIGQTWTGQVIQEA